jgi:hypothetical protein
MPPQVQGSSPESSSDDSFVPDKTARTARAVASASREEPPTHGCGKSSIRVIQRRNHLQSYASAEPSLVFCSAKEAIIWFLIAHAD